MKIFSFLAMTFLLITGAYAEPGYRKLAVEPSNKYGPIQIKHNFYPHEIACDTYQGESGKTINFVKATGVAGEGGGDLTVSVSNQSVSTTKEVALICQTLKNAKAQRKSVELIGQSVTVAEPEGFTEIFWAVLIKLNKRPSE